jgi:hypothetical protein
MKPRIAISAPMTVPMEHLGEVEDLLNEKYEIPYGHISFWDRKSAYDQNQFNQSDAVVVILNDYAFDSSKVINFVVPIGVHRELQEANKQHKKVFLAYRRKTDGVLNLYTASFILGNGDDYKRTAIMGIPTNSSDTFKDWLKTFVSKESEVDDAMKSLGITDCVGIKGPIGNPGKPGPSGIDAQAEIEKEIRKVKEQIDACENWDKVYRKIMTNSVYGMASNSTFEFDSEKNDQALLPNARRFYAQLVSQHQLDNGFDERLLLML